MVDQIILRLDGRTFSEQAFPMVPHQIPELPDISGRDKTAGHQIMLENVGDPLGVLFVGFLPSDCLDVFRVGQNDGAGSFQNVVNRNPILPCGLHTHIFLEPVVVSYRGGRFNVIDGQHRVAAMRKMNGDQNVMVRCKVYSGLTYEEAALCWKLDKAKKRLSLSQATNALVESGLDAEATEIKRLMNCEGFTWALGRKNNKEYEVAATRAVINAYRTLGSAGLLRLFRLLGDTWHGDVHSLTAPVINGMALFLKTYDTELNDRTFVKRLSAVPPEEIARRGKTDFSTSNTALRYARVLLEKYNGVRGGKKLSYRFEC